MLVLCIMFVVPSQAVEISSLETRSKKREDQSLQKDKWMVLESEAMLLDKLEGAKVQERKRTGNGEKRKVVSQLHVHPNVPKTLFSSPIMEEGGSDEGNLDVIPSTEVIDNY